MRPTDIQRQMMARVVSTFLASGAPTPRDELLREFQSLNDLNDLVWHHLFRSYAAGSDPYFPTSWTFHYCGDRDAENTAKRAVQTLAVVLRLQFLSGLIDLSRKGLLKDAQRVDTTFTEKDIELGIYLAAEMNLFQSYVGGNQQQPSIVPNRISEQIVEVKTPFAFWDDFMARSGPWPEAERADEAPLRFPSRARELVFPELLDTDIDEQPETPSIPEHKWTRDQKIGAASRAATVIGIVIAFFTVPEIHTWLHPQPSAGVSSQSSTSSSAPTSETTNTTHDSLTTEVAHDRSTPSAAPAAATVQKKVGARFDWHQKVNWRLHLKVGMTEAQVRALFGEPDRIDVTNYTDDWTYGDFYYSGTLSFDGGVLDQWDEPN